MILILVLGLGGLGAWLYFSDSLAFEDRKAEIIGLFNGERSKLLQTRKAVEERRNAFVKDRDAETQRISQANRALTALRELDSTWEKVFGDRAQQRSYAERREKLLATRSLSLARVGELNEKIRLDEFTLDGLSIGLGRLDKRIEQVKHSESKILHYVRSAWDASKWYLFIAVGSWILGPLLGKVFLFFGIAPWVVSGRPIRFSALPQVSPVISASKVALDLELGPGETLCVKERFLQASDESLLKRTRWLLDWRMPFTSLSCGLTEMIALAHPGTEALRPQVTLSCSGDPLAELSLLTLADHSSMILRPRHIAGVILSAGRLGVRRRWVFNRWQSWVSFQFRYFEFQGPVKILLSGSRGVRVEDLRGRGAEAARRANEGSIIGFTPDLDYKPVRAETFWAYYRNQNSLFDNVFSGQGLFLCQASQVDSDQSKNRFWSGVWSGVLKVFGL